MPNSIPDFPKQKTIFSSLPARIVLIFVIIVAAALAVYAFESGVKESKRVKSGTEQTAP